MIVSGGVKVRSKSKQPKGEGASRSDQLLRTKLKAAVANGTLRDLLWRPVVVNHRSSASSTPSSPPKQQQQRGEDKRPSNKSRSSAARDPYDYEYGDVEPFDEIRIWNELLTARVLKKRRNRFIFSNDTVIDSRRTLSNIFELSAATEDAIDDSLFDGFELSHSNEMFGQTPPLIPIKPPNSAASIASNVSRPASSSDEFIGRGHTFVTLDVIAVETETVPQTAKPPPTVQTRSRTRRNGVTLSEADHARIMLELQERKALPSVGSRDRGTVTVVVAGSSKGMHSAVFDTNDPMGSSGSDTDSLEMTDELDDDDMDEPAPEEMALAVDRLEDIMRQSLPPLVSEAVTEEDSGIGEPSVAALETTGPVSVVVPPDEVEPLSAEGCDVSLEDALLMDDDHPVEGDSEVRST